MAHRRAGDLTAAGLRVAVYYAPALDDPLWSAGCAWLGRDPETAATVRQPDVPGLHALTEDARMYGLHCTLKPPMHLATSYPAFIEDVRALAADLAAFDMPPLAVADLSGFLAIRETQPCPELRALADRCVAELDRHRTSPSAEELARRRKHGLSPGREAMLERWGYPGVFDEWRFHMTLTRRLTPEEHAAVRPAAERHLASALTLPRRIMELCVFTQAAPGAPFLVAERLAFSLPNMI